MTRLARMLPLLGLTLCLPLAARAQAVGVGHFGRGGILVPMPKANLPRASLPVATLPRANLVPMRPPARRGALPLVMGPPGLPAPGLRQGELAGSGQAVPGSALAQATGDPGRVCREAIRLVQMGAAMPAQLMAAIARVESGRPDGHGGVHPWPWTINAEGQGYYYDSKAQAIAAVRALQARGVKSIDVGCMQVNLMYHPDAFATLDQAFDPVANARYAAAFLTRLYGQTRDWTKATALYHSATPELGDAYQRKVAAVLPDELKHLSGPMGGQPNVWSQNAWSSNAWNTGAPAAFRGRTGGFMLGNGASHARIIPMAPGATGRGLAAYRADPVLATK